jgi:hypothetical protein
VNEGENEKKMVNIKGLNIDNEKFRVKDEKR